MEVVKLDTNTGLVLESGSVVMGRVGVAMYFNVSQLLGEYSGASRIHRVDDDLGVDADSDSCHVRGTVKLLKTDRGIWASAELESDFASVCSRCLQSHTQPVNISFEEEFFSRVAPTPFGLEVGEENIGIDERNILDLTETIWQYLQISVPYKPLCREDCQGICSGCGEELNRTECNCVRSYPDSQFGGLVDLVPSGEPKKSVN